MKAGNCGRRCAQRSCICSGRKFYLVHIPLHNQCRDLCLAQGEENTAGVTRKVNTPKSSWPACASAVLCHDLSLSQREHSWDFSAQSTNPTFTSTAQRTSYTQVRKSHHFRACTAAHKCHRTGSSSRAPPRIPAFIRAAFLLSQSWISLCQQLQLLFSKGLRGKCSPPDSYCFTQQPQCQFKGDLIPNANSFPFWKLHGMTRKFCHVQPQRSCVNNIQPATGKLGHIARALLVTLTWAPGPKPSWRASPHYFITWGNSGKQQRPGVTCPG